MQKNTNIDTFYLHFIVQSKNWAGVSISEFTHCVVCVLALLPCQSCALHQLLSCCLWCFIKCTASCVSALHQQINNSIIHSLFHSLCSIHSHFLSCVCLCGCTLSCFPLFQSVPFARCDIALIEQKHVERSDISQGIRAKAGSLWDWQPAFGARGLLGMNVVSVTPDPASCWRGSWPRGVQQNAFVNLIQGSLWTVSREKAGSSDLWNAELFIPMLWKQRWALELARLL